MEEQLQIQTRIFLVDGDAWEYLLPLTYTRSVSGIRLGLRTIEEKWRDFVSLPISCLTKNYLQSSYPNSVASENLLINATVLPDHQLFTAIQILKTNQCLYHENTWIAAKVPGANIDNASIFSVLEQCQKINFEAASPIRVIHRPWHLLQYLSDEIVNDIRAITSGRQSMPLSSSNNVIGPHPVFAEEGVSAEYCIFNTKNGPVYLGKNTEVMEGSMIRGPFALGEGSTVSMGSKMYGPIATGPRCKIGGEIKGVQFFGFGNKGHDGFLGDSIIGEWCNLGADTNSSNLKNNYLPVRAWSYVEEKFVDTGLQFCGLIMGDHSKTGINTMLNTGTVVGAYSNIFGEGYPRTFIPSFAWGGASGFTTHPVQKALETAEIVKSRRNLSMTHEDKEAARAIFEMTAKYRSWEKNA